MEKSQVAFKLKASLFTLTTLHLFNPDTQCFQQQLRLLIEKTPQFFQQLPIILDLSALKAHTGPIDFFNIIHCIRQHNLIPVGVRGGNIDQQTKAAQAGLAQLANIKSEKKEYNTSTPPMAPSITTKLIMQPVRSGQQIYAKNSDLIVVASVSPGAELLADGNIHIYGRLKGRALAGVTGNQNTHIFCQYLEAELIAIAGHYWLSEDFSQQEPTRKTNIRISLEQERLQIKPFA